MSQIAENVPDRDRRREDEVATKLDAIARHVAHEARQAAVESRMIAILSTGPRHWDATPKAGRRAA